MSDRTLFRTIVWAADAFAEPPVHEQAFQMLRALARSGAPLIEPVFVLTPDQLGVRPELVVDWAERYEPAAARVLEKLAKDAAVPGLFTPKIITTTEQTTRAAAKRLIDHARQRHADLIVTSTHARTGVERLFLGSFAESLLLQSPIPVITVNPRSSVAGRLTSLLFATDLGESSRAAFEQVISLAAVFEAQVTIFHKLTIPAALLMPGAPAIAEIERFTADELARCKALARAWCDWARARGVPTEEWIDETPGPIASSILAAATAKATSMIAVVAQSGAIASSLVGSTTRQLVRQSELPVWVVHTRD